MGAWGEGAFDNDEAHDLIFECLNHELPDRRRAMAELLVSAVRSKRVPVTYGVHAIKAMQGLLRDKKYMAMWNNTAPAAHAIKNQISALRAAMRKAGATKGFFVEQEVCGETP
jgi:hypothetical protein